MPPLAAPPARLLAGFLLALAALPAAARELSWPSLEVAARLEADGRLLVSETQTLRMTGDWNGGERRFDVRLGQRLELLRVSRIDPESGAARELVQGDLDQVDHWDWAGSGVVRWRSRLPADPPFEAARLVYRLDYALSGALVRDGQGHYRLAHDFAFGDREGAIERVTVELALASEWRTDAPLPPRFEGGPLASGEGFVVRAGLAYAGAGVPAAAEVERLSPAWRSAALGVVLLGAGLGFARFAWRDGALGRFAPLPPRAEVDGAYLEREVFAIAPEVVGAAWDRAIGSAEVAAMVARLVAEGKVVSSVEAGRGLFRRDNLRLSLRTDRDALAEAERKLIDGLFPTGDETDTASLRRHYAGQGFDPVSRVRAGLETRLRSVRGFEAGSPKPSKLPTAVLVAAGAAALVAAAVAAGARGILPLAIFLGVALVVAWLPGLGGALAGQNRLARLFGPGLAVAISIALGMAALGGFATLPGISLGALAGGTLLELGLVRALFNLMSSRESAASLERRRRLAAARRYFAEELARPAPRLEDRWYPWLVAFELAPRIERWFRRFGGAAAIRGGATSAGSGPFGSAASSGGGWSGGGGSFGGAGASASFAAAVTSMAAGVPSPSSSSGGGGGGSSSGGGGGGGW